MNGALPPNPKTGVCPERKASRDLDQRCREEARMVLAAKLTVATQLSV